MKATEAKWVPGTDEIQEILIYGHFLDCFMVLFVFLKSSILQDVRMGGYETI